MVSNLKLTGRFQLCHPDDKKAGQVHIQWVLSDPELELRYIDQKRMGQLYLCNNLSQIQGFHDMGPEAHEIGLEDFKQRLRPFRGEIKGILTRGKAVAGIGNAYADEILWAARVHPYRKRPSLTSEELDQLHNSMVHILQSSIDLVREEMGEDIHRKPRDFFQVHMREGQPCPSCGSRISLIQANQRITNFCRTCQPGGNLFRK
jgi:formamidopyrimidine-DNA glycosylase